MNKVCTRRENEVCGARFGPFFFNFMEFWGKNGQNNRLAPPPLGNPGSATGCIREHKLTKSKKHLSFM